MDDDTFLLSTELVPVARAMQAALAAAQRLQLDGPQHPRGSGFVSVGHTQRGPNLVVAFPGSMEAVPYIEAMLVQMGRATQAAFDHFGTDMFFGLRLVRRGDDMWIEAVDAGDLGFAPSLDGIGTLQQIMAEPQLSRGRRDPAEESLMVSAY